MIVTKVEFNEKSIHKIPFGKDAIYEEKRRIAHDVYGGQCYICQTRYGSGHAFHHIEYDPSRKTHKDFTYTWDYNAYMFPEVLQYPERFYLLCKICHARIDQPRYGYLGHIKKDRLERLFEVAFKTIPAPKKSKPPTSK